MAIFQSPLGMGIVNNPLTDSPYVEDYDFGGTNIPLQDGILTENSVLITTENGVFLTTE